MIIIRESSAEEETGACYLGGGSCGPDSDDHDGSCKQSDIFSKRTLVCTQTGVLFT